ncbi:ATPase component [Pseudomonas syringae pv. actinidiae]|uniref:ATPase component n=1 Tax=Pseudomonas syringae pv. actinidiae TaxID=103796 RepID=A0AAN4TIB3_PSESF|nr:ATPase component [Pseudomonas syringae pv. actinidiae]
MLNERIQRNAAHLFQFLAQFFRFCNITVDIQDCRISHLAVVGGAYYFALRDCTFFLYQGCHGAGQLCCILGLHANGQSPLMLIFSALMFGGDSIEELLCVWALGNVLVQVAVFFISDVVVVP